MSKQDELRLFILNELDDYIPGNMLSVKTHNILEQMKEELEGFNSEIEDELLAEQDKNRKLRDAISSFNKDLLAIYEWQAQLFPYTQLYRGH